MKTTWSVKETIFSPREDVAEQFKLSPIILSVLHERGYSTPEAVHHFLHGTLEDLHDPYLMKDMDCAVRRIISAVDGGELILIHGDYDVDGVTASAVLAKVFETLNVPFLVYLPHRLSEGYGFGQEAVDYAKRHGVSLIVTVDCGISSFNEVKYACSLGIDVVVTDHHRALGHELPPAVAVVDPWRLDCVYPFKELSGVGVVYKLARALIGEAADEFIDLVALGTVGDVVPLVGENRILVKLGMREIDKAKRVGLRALAKVAGLRSQKTKTNHLGYIFGPRLNACGRMGSADRAFHLLTAENDHEAESLAKTLDTENRERQRLEREITKRAIAKVEKEFNFNRDRVVVVWGRGWHPGVIGIVASRLVERFYRPSIVISLDNGKGKGSGRSIEKFDLFSALEKTGSHLLEFGGHEAAAGLSISESKLKAFREEINEIGRQRISAADLLRTVTIDAAVDLRDLSYQFLKQLELLEPFGSANPRPVFLTRGLRFKEPPSHYDGRTLRARVTDGSQIAEIVWYRCVDFLLNEDATFDLVYSPTLRRRDGMEGLLLEVKDLRYIKPL